MVTESLTGLRIKKIDGLGNVDSLGPNSKGSKSIRELENGRLFTTGVASECITAVVVHNEIGIGASHRNPVDITSLNGLKQTLTETITEAISEFRSLIPKKPLPKNGLKILVAGMDFLDQEMIPDMESSLIGAIGTNPNFNDGLMLGKERYVDLNHKIGIRNGIIWGGPKHPRFSEPTYYNLK